MIFSFIFFSLRVLKYLFFAALVLAYIEAGPGGAQLEAIVEAFKEAILSVDWDSVADSLKASFEAAVAAAQERLSQ